MHRLPVCRTWICTLLLATFLFAGCALQEVYRHETIKTRHTDLGIDPQQSPASGESEPMGVPDSRLDLEKVLNLARSNNPDILMAMARIQQAQAMLEKSAAPFYPQINVYTEYMQGDGPSAYLFKAIDQRKLPPGTDFNDPGWFENFESGISAAINLYSGGRDSLGREMARTGLTISKLDLDSIENQVMATAIGAYYDVLAAANFVRVAAEAVETTRSQLRIMRIRFQSGGALKTDLLSLEVRMAETEEILVQSRNRQRLAKAALAEILGMPPELPLDLVNIDEYAVHIPDDPIAARAYALAHRPELASARHKLRLSEMAVDAARAGYFPRVDFQTRYYADDPEMKYSSGRDNWTAGLYLNWNIFDGFATRSDCAKALSQLQETMAADRKIVLAVKFDVKKAYLNLDEARQRLTVAMSNVETARETYHLVKRQYGGGSVNISRYLEAELAYNRARMRETAAYFDREKARAQIARATGYWTGNRETDNNKVLK
ncbi:MAG: transporter [Proteobacteria bacterium]|nr:MAG: transporter [Pseudomonadota bacterium]PIE67327.1 MAG: transporter [Deltaproteobacteria bacterium]